MARFLSNTPTKSQQEDLKTYNRVVNSSKKAVPEDIVDVDAFVEDLVIQDIQRECGHGVTSRFVKDYIMEVPSQSQVWSDTRKARLKSKHTLDRGVGFNIWINDLIVKPHIFSRWFTYLPFPNDFYRSFNLIFELIYKSKLTLTLHEEYMELFHEAKELRIPLSALKEEELRVVHMLKVRHSDLFNKKQVIISGSKVVYSELKTDIVVDRKCVIRHICAHFLSCAATCDQVLPILGILSNALRNLELYDLYEELLKTEMPGVKLFRKLPDDYCCPQCSGYDEKSVGTFEPRTVWHFAHDIDESATQYYGLSVLPYDQRVHGWCHLLNAYAVGNVTEIGDPETRKIADKFLLGYEPVGQGRRRAWGVVPDDLEVVAQRYPKDGNPFTVFSEFKYEPTAGIKLSYIKPLQIYPPGEYGGYFSVYITEDDRLWQKSQIIKKVHEQESRKYVPLAPCLWFLIHHGDLEVLTRIIQEWMPFSSHIRKRVRENPVPKRCLNRKNWLALVTVGEIIRPEQDSLECMWILIHNFVMVYQTPPFIQGKKLDIDMDMFWEESLSNLPSGIRDCFNIETTNKKLTSPESIFRTTNKGGTEIISQPRVDSGEIRNELWHCFYVAEAKLNGIIPGDYPQPFTDDIEVTWKGKVVELDELILISPQGVEHNPPPDVVRKPLKICKCTKISYQEQQALLRIQEQREKARLERESMASQDSRHQASVMAHFEKTIL